MGEELIVERRTALPVSAEAAWAWHAAPGFGAFDRLAPPWRRVDVVERPAALVNGARLIARIGVGPFAVRWTADHRDVEPGRGFADIQVDGPFERWVHQHRFEPRPDGTAELHDRIVAALPPGLRAARREVTREIARVLAYRHALTAAELAMHATAASRPRLHVAITGASGLLGSTLVPALTAGGHRVTKVVRGRPGPSDIPWDPAGGRLDPERLAGVDAVIHLAGENIGARWTPERKRRIQESRRDGTRLLAEAMARASRPPPVLVSVSAVGFYGDRGEEVLTDASPPGEGFLPDVALAWEAATAAAESAGIRVARPRLGLVMTPRGGLLRRMLPPFRLGLGGRLASGSQWQSWLSIDDVVEVMHRGLFDERLRGSFNATAPEPVRNAGMTRTLAGLLRCPAVLPVPAAALRLVFGEMADQAILASTRAVPARLEGLGHAFRHPKLEAALEHLLGRSRAA
ncbi:MAG: TIGR01777 family oxidoreductase [Gemmatimonadales bacterium]